MLKRLLPFVLAIFFLCSCTKNNVEEITFSSWGSITETKILNKLITEFEKENPSIKVNFIHVPQNYFQKIHLLIASSTAPDVIFINNLYLPVYAEQLECLDEIIDKNAFHNKSIEALSYNGKLMAVPRDISNLIFYYNKNIVKAIDSNWSLKDFENIISDATNEKHWGVSYERDIYMAQPYILTMGFDDGINFYKNMEGEYAPRPSDVGSSTLAQMFLDGKIALYLSGRWMYPKIKESASFPFRIVIFPGIVPADASGWALSKNSKHKTAAIKFIKYLSSAKSSNYFTETNLIVPARIDSSNYMNEKIFLEAIEHSKVMEYGKNYNKTRDLMNKKYFEN